LPKDSNLFGCGAVASVNGATTLAHSTPGGVHRWSLGIVIAASLSVTGCAAPLAERAGTHAVRLTDIQFTPERVPAGCPARLTIRFKDPQADVVLAKAQRKQEQSNRIVRRRTVTLPFRPEQLAGKKSREATTEIRPDQPGTYSYSVQVEDTEGNKSNVLQTVIEVDGWRPEC
jgi:hypothetical protein